MAHSACVPRLTMADSGIVQPARHSVVVRVTHWIIGPPALSVWYPARVAILLALLRLYWAKLAFGALPHDIWILLKSAYVRDEL
jgi:hypothetical protein